MASGSAWKAVVSASVTARRRGESDPEGGTHKTGLGGGMAPRWMGQTFPRGKMARLARRERSRRDSTNNPSKRSELENLLTEGLTPVGVEGHGLHVCSVREMMC